MPEVDIACPKCLPQGRRVKLQTPDGFRYTCQNGCVFDDSTDLFGNKLESFSGKKFQPPPPEPPANAVAFQLAVPADVRDRLQAKYKEKLDLTLVAIMGALSLPDCFLIGAEDINRLSLLLKRPFENPSTLCGLVYNVVQQLEEADRQIKEMSKVSAAAPGSNGGVQGLSVELPPDVLAKIAEKAVFNGKGLRQYLSETIQFAVANDWL